MTPAEGAQCAVHSALPALSVCSRCGGFCCEACLVPARLPPLCLACERVVEAAPSSRSSWSVGLAAFSLVGLCCAPFVPVLSLALTPAAMLAGPLGVGLALVERAAIARGEAPRRGRARTTVALFLGALFLGLLLLGGLALVAVKFRAFKA